ncbi:Ras guanine nucleotide exchange factor bud5 [Cladophialophora chaetospira]|uniref:Ras guanine nucleotide exchange factor bud5 n=1 Tax=Cladophialophora chaetospira TaxID=386627 RepID=A0AA38UDN3_9EURO|nr:Ras guanine nucleotide exchange factor bud5 [Cladophialophora chaetospira]
MRETQPSSVYIAPLRLRKDSDEDNHGAMEESTLAASIPSPRSIESLDEMSPSPARFHNYLRALYAFQPSSPHSSTTVTLPLGTGDIILVHSVHVNGWADGTLLETGARGWLPTNYCEGYDYAAMRPLLKALTEFWDLVRCASETNLSLFRNQDYMRGLVAGVRALLERSDCLTRDCSLVKQQDAIRRTRKSLLSDLALLVRAAKELQQVVVGHTTDKEMLDIRLDDMLLKAFRIVTRAVLFYDVWTEQVDTAPEASTRPAESSSDSIAVAPSRRSSRSQSTIRRHVSTSVKTKTPVTTGVPNRNSSAANATHVRRHSSITHRMSYTRPPTLKNSNLISDFLHRSYDEFLTVLASFLGSHMQSRSSSELLLTTQNAVRACRQLFAVVETVIDRDYSTSRPLVQAKDSMYDAITELVHAARQVFKPIRSMDDDLIYSPDEAHSLVQAATACVSAAGRCVTRTKATLEEIGDFEIDNLSYLLGRSSGGSSTPEPTSRTLSPEFPPASAQVTKERHNNTHERPRITVNQGLLTPPLSFNNTVESPSTGSGSVPPTPKDDIMLGVVRSSPLGSSSVAPQKPSLTPAGQRASTDLRHHRISGHVVGDSTSSDSSFGRSDRHSNPSNLSSASTRVTSFHEDADLSLKPLISRHSHDARSDSIDVADAEAEILVHSFAQELVFNREGAIVGGSLNALVERLTTPESTPDVSFVTTMFLTFRLFVTPVDFAHALRFRFEYVGDNADIAGPVRLRVYNMLKGWMESHWRHDCDDTALPVIVAFARESLPNSLPMAGKRILELVEKVSMTHAPIVPRVISAIGKTSTSTASYVDPSTPLPNPVISKSQLTALRAWKMGGSPVTILDFDPLEIARQITLKASGIFCSILPEELLGTEWTKRNSSLAVNVRAMSTLSTDISNLVSDSVLQLEEPKKRAVIIKQWVKIANKCLELHNFDTVMAIVCSLDSTNLKRMKKTWEYVPQKTKTILDDMCKIIDVSRNYAVLRQRIQSQMPPCLPFIGVYLTDLTMVDSANPSTRPLSINGGETVVINLDKHMKTAKIISDLQRFQVPYRFAEVPELQTWMQDQLIRVRSAGDKSFQLHYRRSLILEPKELSRSPNPETGSGKDRDKFDFLTWAHLGSKEKTLSVSG